MDSRCWDLLGVDRHASQEQIKAAFRLKIKECHPDINGRHPERNANVRELIDAYHQALSSVSGSARLDALFQQTYDHKAAATVDAGLSPTDLWRLRLIQERTNSVVQAVLMLAILAAPISLLVFGFLAASPYMQEMSAKRTVSYGSGRGMQDLRAYQKNQLIAKTKDGNLVIIQQPVSKQ